MNDLEQLIQTQAPTIAKGLKQAAAQARNEADFVAEAEDLIADFIKHLDVSPRLDRERTLINGRADAVYNRFVIEYEPPRSLKANRGARPNQHAVGQVRQYIEELSRIERQKQERIAGVATDGNYFIFARFRDGHWRVDDPVPVTDHSTETFLRYLSSLATELALTPENLVRDFGENTFISRLCVSAFYEALTTTQSSKVHILFNQWQLQFSEICGYEEGSTRLDVAGLARSYGVKAKKPDSLRLFFAIHSYYATFIKLLAVQIASFYMMPKLGTGLAQVASYDSAGLLKYLADMERGGIFRNFGINNFMEGDFFGWYLDIWSDRLDQAVRRIIADLSNYSLVTLDVDPEETRDLLKRLYQNLMPKKLRHALGEYYTPDWLAERLLNQLGYQGNPAERLLDPACGSGTFLVLAIKRVRQYAEDKMLPEAEVLEQILRNIVGFDLNPLAVISARTNYLLALGDLLQYRRGEISLPVYLADSIMTPSIPSQASGQIGFLEAESDKVRPEPGYSFNTSVGRFSVPQSLVNAGDIDRLADLLEESVQNRLDLTLFQTHLTHTFPKLVKKINEIDLAKDLYLKLMELDKKGINGIWARIVKNAFAPLFSGGFDYVAGNPPWVNWESLPDEYRRSTVPLWQKYNLFSHKGFDAILGKAKDDISILMTYVAMDKYLQFKGRLGFVITQSVFKTSGAGQGFRRLRLDAKNPIRVVHVDDFTELQPFEGASNRTAVIILEKGNTTKWPVPYAHWKKTKKGVGLHTDLSLEEVQEIASYKNFVAEPVSRDDITSSWVSGRPRALKAIRNLLGASDYLARAGVCTWLNGVYWIDVIGQRPDKLIVVSNLPESGKIKVDKVQTTLEKDLLYPLLRASDVSRWHAISINHIIVTHKEGMGLKAIPEKEMSLNYPKTYGYLKHFEDVLRSRSGYKRYFKNTDPFYSVFNIGDYTFSPYKVVWTRIASSMASAVAIQTGVKPLIPQETVTLVDCSNEKEAYYLCAMLNSSPFNFAAQSYSQRGGKSFASPHILEHIRVPSFKKSNFTQEQIANLAKQAHQVTIDEDMAQVQIIEAEIDKLAAKLWNLTDAELKDIQQSLKELR